MTELTLTSALLIGLLGSSHCLGMCGGLSSIMGVGPGKGNRSRLVSYNAGRLLTYTSIGALAGLFGEQLLSTAPQFTVLLRSMAGLLLIAMGLYVSQVWMGLTYLEKVGAYLWRYLQPLTRKLLPIENHGQAILLGSLWGLLPCGLVYSTVSWSLAAAQWQQSALFMLAFGIGTLPAMLSVGLASERLLARLRQKKFRLFSGLIIIVMGLLTMPALWGHGNHGTGHGGAHQGSEHQSSEHPKTEHQDHSAH